MQDMISSLIVLHRLVNEPQEDASWWKEELLVKHAQETDGNSEPLRLDSDKHVSPLQALQGVNFHLRFLEMICLTLGEMDPLLEHRQRVERLHRQQEACSCMRNSIQEKHSPP